MTRKFAQCFYYAKIRFLILLVIFVDLEIAQILAYEERFAYSSLDPSLNFLQVQSKTCQAPRKTFLVEFQPFSRLFL